MSINMTLAARVRQQFSYRLDVTERNMFGALVFLVRGHMCCGVGDELTVRVGPNQHNAALARPHTRPFDFTGTPFTGFVYVDPAGLETDAQLAEWLNLGLDFVLSLPPKYVDPSRL